MSKDAVLQWVAPGSVSTSVTASAPNGAVAVNVENTSSFAENGATVVIAGNIYEVESISDFDDSGAGTLYLASGLIAPVYPDEPVQIITAVGEEAAVWTATVDLGDPDSEPFTVTIPDKLRRSYKAGDEQAGSLIELTDDLTEVSSVPGQYAREEAVDIPEGQISGRVTIGGGVSRPGQGPRVGEFWEDPSLYLQSSNDPTFGLWRGLYDNGDTWVSTRTLNGGSLSFIDKISGDETSVGRTLPDNFNALGGAVRQGTRWYVLGVDLNRSNGWYVYVYDDAPWTKVNEWPVTRTGTQPTDPVICVDGGNVRITYWTIASGNIKRIISNAYTVAGTITGATLTINASAKQTIMGTYYGAADFGSTRLVVLGRAIAYVFDPVTSELAPGESWTPATVDGEHRGVGWDGFNFYTLGSSARIWRYEPVKVPTTRRVEWTKYDPDVGNGVRETKPSPVTVFRQRARAPFQVIVPSINEGSPPDIANVARIYIDSHLQPDWLAGQTSKVYGPIDTVAAPPPLTEGFLGVAGAGALTTAAEDTLGPISWLEGAGPGMVGPLGWAADRGPSETTVVPCVVAAGWDINSMRADAWGLDVLLSVTLTRTGAAITVAPSGDIATETVATFDPRWVPYRDWPAQSMGLGRVATWQLDDTAGVLLCAVGGGSVNIATGEQLSVAARYMRKIPT